MKQFIIVGKGKGTYNTGNPINETNLFELGGGDEGLYAPISHSHSWSQITSKPSTFTPSAHNHDDRYYTETESDSRFAPISHTHNWSTITGKPTTFPPSAHTHNYENPLTFQATGKALVNRSGNTITIGVQEADPVLGNNIALGILSTSGGAGASTTHKDYIYATDGVKDTDNYTAFGEGTSSISGSESAYLEIDLGQIYNCLENRIWFYDKDTRNYFYKLKYSTDGVNWSYAVGSASNFVEDTSTDNEAVITNIGSVKARYWRIYANGNSINQGNHIYEWEIYENIGGDGTAPTSWSSIINKPTTFPPSAHTHPWSAITGVPTFDNYQYWKLGANGSYQNVVATDSVNFIGSGNTSVSRSGHTITISSTAGTGADGNNYLTGVTGSGNGTVTFARNGLSGLTWSAAHSHSWSEITSKPILDNYQNWELGANGSYQTVSSTEKVNFIGSGSTTVSRTGHTITISSTGGTGGDGNNYLSSAAFNTSNGVITLNRTGLSAVTVDIDGRFLPLTGGTLSGNITAPAFYESSLREYKENINPFQLGALDLVQGLEIVTFDRIDGAKNKVGIIADDTDKNFLNEEGTAVDLYKTIFIQAKAIQELNDKVEEQEKRLQRLEKLLQ